MYARASVEETLCARLLLRQGTKIYGRGKTGKLNGKYVLHCSVLNADEPSAPSCFVAVPLETHAHLRLMLHVVKERDQVSLG